jgi:hypothetical protein
LLSGVADPVYFAPEAAFPNGFGPDPDPDPTQTFIVLLFNEFWSKNSKIWSKHRQIIELSTRGIE